MLELAAAFLAVIFTTPSMIRLGLKLGVTGIDIHKPWKPVISKLGGISLIFGALAGIAIYWIIGGGGLPWIVLVSGVIASLIGLLEDVRGEISPRVKPLLLILASIPILLSGSYVPRPVIPFVGRTRLYRVYPFMIALAYPITCNAVNSVDVLNGSMIYTSVPFFIMTLIISYLRGDSTIFTISAIMLAALIAFIPYNRYPARVFPGNSGSLFIGAVMASIAILGRVEFAAIIALLPQIMNEMHILFSIGGIKSARFIKARPVEFVKGYLTASRSRDAPITLVRMLSAETEVDERRMVYAMAVLSIFAMILGLITDLLFIEGMI